MLHQAKLVLLPLVLALSACRAEATIEPIRQPIRPEPLSGVGEQGQYQFEMALNPDPPVVGEFFQITTRIRDARTGEPINGADFNLDASMPEHGHGMNTVPQHHEQSPGTYVTEGMKFHMPGSWAITARASKDGRTDQMTLRYEQPPRSR